MSERIVFWIWLRMPPGVLVMRLPLETSLPPAAIAAALAWYDAQPVP